MKNRLTLQAAFEAMLGSRNVYFQPTENINLKYPAIVYRLRPPSVHHADDKKYIKYKCYEVVYIHKNPDDTITDVINDMKYCEFDRRYISDNLYHDSFVLYY